MKCAAAFAAAWAAAASFAQYSRYKRRAPRVLRIPGALRRENASKAVDDPFLFGITCRQVIWSQGEATTTNLAVGWFYGAASR